VFFKIFNALKNYSENTLMIFSLRDFYLDLLLYNSKLYIVMLIYNSLKSIFKIGCFMTEKFFFNHFSRLIKYK